MFAYFLYVGILTYVKNYSKNFYESHKRIFDASNEWLNIFYSFYINVFFTVLVELNCSMAFSSSRSLLTAQRIDNLDVAFYQLFFGFIGLFMTITMAVIATYFFRSYEFMEHNLLKRRNTFLSSLFLFLKLALTIVYFSHLS